MNISTSNISFNGSYMLKDHKGEVQEELFTNDREVLECLEKTVQGGVITKAKITNVNLSGVPCVQASLKVNDVFEIYTEKAEPSYVKRDGLSVRVRIKDENGEKNIHIDDPTFGKNTVLNEQLSTFIAMIFEKVMQAKDESQKVINNQVIDLLSPKKVQPPTDDD